jgi:hypothetical protein
MNHVNMDISRSSVGAAPWLMPPGMALPEGDAAPLKDIPVAELGIRHLLGTKNIGQIAQLRGAIDLAAAASADPHFMHREKKETNWAWSTLSSFTATS